MAFRLPPLNTLRIFEAAGRLGSFKRASEELHVTPSAVSHGVRVLEEWLATPLFERTRQGLTLTAEAAAFLASVQGALTALSQETERLAGRRATGRLSISVAPTFAARWLLPRLSDFAQRHPDVLIAIDTSRRSMRLPADGVDLAIRMAAGRRPGGRWVPLARESLLPVCSPRYAALLEGSSADRSFARATLVHVTTVSEDWSAWLAAAGLGRPAAPQDIRVDTIQLALEAAAQGLGIALGRTPLIENDLATGRLVPAHELSAPCKTRYWLVCTDREFDRPETRLFRNWILEQLSLDGGRGRARADAAPRERRAAS
jgi:LysR family transcriptional regulator, glycine cleavage system transcriptional activator